MFRLTNTTALIALNAETNRDYDERSCLDAAIAHELLELLSEELSVWDLAHALLLQRSADFTPHH